MDKVFGDLETGVITTVVFKKTEETAVQKKSWKKEMQKSKGKKQVFGHSSSSSSSHMTGQT
jgi:hypothetical protein